MRKLEVTRSMKKFWNYVISFPNILGLQFQHYSPSQYDLSWFTQKWSHQVDYFWFILLYKNDYSIRHCCASNVSESKLIRKNIGGGVNHENEIIQLKLTWTNHMNYNFAQSFRHSDQFKHTWQIPWRFLKLSKISLRLRPFFSLNCGFLKGWNPFSYAVLAILKSFNLKWNLDKIWIPFFSNLINNK